MSAHVAFTSVHVLGGSTIYSKAPRIAELVTTSGTSNDGETAARSGEIARVKAVGFDLYVRMGKPGDVVTATTGHHLSNGEYADLGICADGDVLIAIRVA